MFLGEGALKMALQKLVESQLKLERSLRGDGVLKSDDDIFASNDGVGVRASFEQLEDDCIDKEYGVDLTVMGSVGILLDSQTNGCRHYYITATESPNGGWEKTIVMLKNGLESLEKTKFTEKHGVLISLGKYPLRTLKLAYEDASASSPGYEGKPSNLLHNNAGAFLCNFAKELKHVSSENEKNLIATALQISDPSLDNAIKDAQSNEVLEKELEAILHMDSSSFEDDIGKESKKEMSVADLVGKCVSQMYE